MRKLILLFAFLMFLQFQAKSQFHVGPEVSFLTDGDAFGVGANTLFNVTDQVKGSLNGHYYFGGKINWDLNLDVHYQLVEIGQDTYFNAFTGLNIREEDEPMNADDVDLGVGINFGLFFHTPIADGMRLFLEGKFSLVINGSSGGGFTAGVFF
jgi:hypothetical protein